MVSSLCFLGRVSCRASDRARPNVAELGRYSRWSQIEVQAWIEEQKAARKAA